MRETRKKGRKERKKVGMKVKTSDDGRRKDEMQLKRTIRSKGKKSHRKKY